MFSLDGVVPWGRSFDEYSRMFALTSADFGGRILGCGDGPASFNAEGTRRGHSIVSIDPIYQWAAADIQQRIDVTAETVLEQTARHAAQFAWESIPSVEALADVRLSAMRDFIIDYETGRGSGRYVAGSLPHLPFDSASFDLGLCSHFLFLYGEHFDERFHRDSVRELARVADEIRIFPLLALNGARSAHLEACVDELRALDRDVSIERVPYEFQRGGNEMLRASARNAMGRMRLVREDP